MGKRKANPDLDDELKLYAALSPDGVQALADHFGLSIWEVRKRMITLGVIQGKRSISKADVDKWNRQGTSFLKWMAAIVIPLLLVGCYAILTKKPDKDLVCLDDKFPCTTLKEVKERVR